MIELYNGDCLEIMDSLIEKGIKVDAIITDPPYKLIGGGHVDSQLRDYTQMKIDKRKSVFTTNGEPFRIKTLNFKEWIPKLNKLLFDDSYIIIMSNDRNLFSLHDLLLQEGFKFCELLVMRKQNVVISSYFYKCCEFVLLFRKNKYKKFNKYGVKNVFDVKLPRGKNKVHPTEKDKYMFISIIESITKEDDLVLDPFMGSGTTGVACKNLNRNFIGIELDKEYFEIAKNRIEETNIKEVSK